MCERHGVPLAAAAIQFPLGLDTVASIIPGAVRPEEVLKNHELHDDSHPHGSVG